MDIKVTITQEHHDVMLSQMRKKYLTELGQKSDNRGNLLYLDVNGAPTVTPETGGVDNIAFMGQLPVLDDNDNPIIVDDLTVQEWLQNTIEGKINACLKRVNPVSVLEAENLALRADVARLEARDS